MRYFTPRPEDRCSLVAWCEVHDAPVESCTCPELEYERVHARCATAEGICVAHWQDGADGSAFGHRWMPVDAASRIMPQPVDELDQVADAADMPAPRSDRIAWALALSEGMTNGPATGHYAMADRVMADVVTPLVLRYRSVRVAAIRLTTQLSVAKRNGDDLIADLEREQTDRINAQRDARERGKELLRLREDWDDLMGRYDRALNELSDARHGLEALRIGLADAVGAGHDKTTSYLIGLVTDLYREWQARAEVKGLRDEVLRECKRQRDEARAEVDDGLRGLAVFLGVEHESLRAAVDAAVKRCATAEHEAHELRESRFSWAEEAVQMESERDGWSRAYELKLQDFVREMARTSAALRACDRAAPTLVVGEALLGYEGAQKDIREAIERAGDSRRAAALDGAQR